MNEFRGQEYQSQGYEAQSQIKEHKEKAIVEKGQFSTAKVLLWLGLGLLITGIVALGMPDLLVLIAKNMGGDQAAGFYLSAIIASAVLLLVSIIVINVQAFFKNKGVMITFYVIYTISMGVFLSALMLDLFYEEPTSFMKTVSSAFLITSAVFLVFGFIGMKAKINHLLLWVVMVSLLGGALSLSLFAIFMPRSAQFWASMIITGVLLLYMVLMVVIDFNRVKMLAENKSQITNGDNLAIYCAYNLYVDFIYIFIRILIILAASRRN